MTRRGLGWAEIALGRSVRLRYCRRIAEDVFRIVAIVKPNPCAQGFGLATWRSDKVKKIGLSEMLLGKIALAKCQNDNHLSHADTICRMVSAWIRKGEMLYEKMPLA